MPFQDKTILITGSTRGIGRAIALKFAKAGARVVITGKTTEPHAKLEGTIHSVKASIEALGGTALALPLDVRDERMIQDAIETTVKTFGRLDILVNNASAISLTGTLETRLKRFDLMMGVNARGTFACSQAAIPYLLETSDNPHILNISPPLNMAAKWFKNHLAYTYAKYGMSMCTLGMAEEFKSKGLAVNSLWPKTTIATAAIAANFPPQMMEASRDPDIMADAAYTILQKDSRTLTGQFLIDEEVLREAGVTDFSTYSRCPEAKLMKDLYLE